MKRSSKPRRQTSKLITDAALDYQSERLRGLTRCIAERLSKLKGEKERRRAERILLDAEGKAGLAALAWLREFKVPIYKACIYSSMSFAKRSLSKGEAEFKFLSPKEVKTQDRSFAFVPILDLYTAIAKDLTILWNQPINPELTGHGYSHSVSKKGRFGPAQQLGLRKYAAQNTARTAAVVETVKKYIDESERAFFGMPEIIDRLAGRWVRDQKTPSQIAMQILAHFMRAEPRTIKDLLIKARKLSKISTAGLLNQSSD